MTGTIRLRRLTVRDAAAVQAIVEADPGYSERVSGRPAGPREGRALLLGRPPGFPADRKIVLGAYAEEQPDELVAVVDLLVGWPKPTCAHVGLLQVRAASHGRGVGRRVHEQLLAEVGRWPEVDTLRAAIVETNAEVAEPFWQAMGYRPTGPPRPYRNGTVDTTLRIWTRPV
ncbi:GNAT family N-acetyltransferase [Nocardioides sp. MAHUQ-72]|uniref:GNAT family N-acetyltransferase n=1 Tax=unclassified Nocardioides TaxID=2615069 RepID=UPI00361EC441